MTYMLPANFEEGLFKASRQAFMAILERDSADAIVFASRADRFKIHGLLSYRTSSQFKPKEIHVDQTKMDDSRYRRKLVRELKAPRPSKWVYHNVQLDRTRLASNEGYLNDMSKLLAYKWTQALLPVDSAVSALLLLKQDADFITVCLDKFGPHEISAEAIASYRLRSFIEDAVDKNETLQAGLAEIRRVGAEARRRFSEEMAVVRKEILREFGERVDSILTDTRKNCAETLAATNSELAASAEHSRKVLDESGYPNRDPEKEWREQLRKADEAREASRPKLGWKGNTLVTLACAGTATLLGFFMEVEGVTPFAALAGLFN